MSRSRKALCVGLLTLLGFSLGCSEFVVIGIESELAAGWLDARFGMRSHLLTFPLQAVLLCMLSLVGPAMPAALVVILAIGLSMYLLSVPVISMFMKVAARRHPKALTLASSLEPMAFNVGIAFGTAVGGAVVSGPGMGVSGYVGAAFALVALALSRLTMRLDRRAPCAVASSANGAVS